MATFTTFEDIQVWKRGHETALKIYQLSNTTELDKDFGLKNQMRRSAVSITSNIAEGFDRNNNKEFIYFLRIAKASSSELRSQLLLARDLNYIDENDFSALNRELIEIGKMLTGLMVYLRRKVMKS